MEGKSKRETAKGAKEEDAKIAEESLRPLRLLPLRPLRLIFRPAKTGRFERAIFNLVDIGHKVY